MTTIAQKIIEVREDINKGPDNVVQGRLSAVNAIQLADEVLANSTANALTTNVTGLSYPLDELTFRLAQQRANLEGAQNTDVQRFETIANTTIYSSGTDFTFPIANNTVCEFGVQVLTADGETEITLSSTPLTKQTITYSNGTTNSVSTFFDDYYFVQSRRTGSLVATTDFDEIPAQTLPNAVTPIGEDTPMGSTILPEDTWNEQYVKMNIDALTTVNDIQVLTMERALQNGSQNNFSVPELYSPLLMKRKVEDANEPADSVAFIAIVVCEGLRINTDWLPVGDNTGSYSAENANTYKAALLSDEDFLTRTGKYNPVSLQLTNTVNDSTYANTFPVWGSLAANIQSTSEEIPQYQDSYPNKEALVFYPYVQNIDDLQPTGLSGSDVFAGRYVHIERDRKDESGAADEEYRFVIDQAAKFFYLTNPLLSTVDGTRSVQTLPTVSDPQAKYQENFSEILTVPGSINTDQGYHDQVSSLYTHTHLDDFANTNNQTFVYPSFTHFVNASYSSTSASAAVANFTSNGVYTTGTGTYQYSYNSVGGGSTVYYYILSGDADRTLHYDRQTVNITRDTFASGSPAVTNYRVNFTVTTVTTPIEPSFRYNLVADFLASANGTLMNASIRAAQTQRSTYDPHFEVAFGGTAINDDAQEMYEDFYSNTGSVYTAYNTFKSKQDEFFDNRTGWSTHANTWSTHVLSLWNDFTANLVSWEPHRVSRIDIINRRIGTPAYKNQFAPNDRSGTKRAVAVTTIPPLTSGEAGSIQLEVNTTDSSSGEDDIILEDGSSKIVLESAVMTGAELSGTTPYGRKIYDAINFALDSDIGVIRNAVEAVRNIGAAFDKINSDRNVYEVLNNRSKIF